MGAAAADRCKSKRVVAPRNGLPPALSPQKRRSSKSKMIPRRPSSAPRRQFTAWRALRCRCEHATINDPISRRIPILLVEGSADGVNIRFPIERQGGKTVGWLRQLGEHLVSVVRVISGRLGKNAVSGLRLAHLAGAGPIDGLVVCIALGKLAGNVVDGVHARTRGLFFHANGPEFKSPKNRLQV